MWRVDNRQWEAHPMCDARAGLGDREIVGSRSADVRVACR